MLGLLGPSSFDTGVSAAAGCSTADGSTAGVGEATSSCSGVDISVISGWPGNGCRCRAIGLIGCGTVMKEELALPVDTAIRLGCSTGVRSGDRPPLAPSVVELPPLPNPPIGAPSARRVTYAPSPIASAGIAPLPV